MATDLQILQALRAAVNAQLTAAGAGTVSLVRLGNAINRGLQRLNSPTWTVVVAGSQWSRVNGPGDQVYVSRTGGPSTQTAELHVFPGGAELHLYSGTPDSDSDSPLEGLAFYYRESVDPSAVATAATPAAWLTARITAGLPAVPS